MTFVTFPCGITSLKSTLHQKCLPVLCYKIIMETDEVEKESASAAPKAKEHALIAADLEKVTDYAEENVISGQDMSTAIAALDGGRTKEQTARAERERELAKVTIKKLDVDLVVQEMEISRTEAERSLRENQGDVVQALLQLVN